MPWLSSKHLGLCPLHFRPSSSLHESWARAWFLSRMKFEWCVRCLQDLQAGSDVHFGQFVPHLQTSTERSSCIPTCPCWRHPPRNLPQKIITQLGQSIGAPPSVTHSTECLCGGVDDLLVRHVPQMLIDVPTVAERILELAVPVAP